MASKRQQTSDRNERLARQLRANLHKRKVQARARRAGDADRRQAGICAARSDENRDREDTS